jgi:hypothetical protein
MAEASELDKSRQRRAHVLCRKSSSADACGRETRPRTPNHGWLKRYIGTMVRIPTTEVEDFPLGDLESFKCGDRIDWAVILLLVLGAGLRLFQYLVNSSLWSDELGIVLNVSRRGVLDLLTHPLAFHQMAPPGFLLSLKLMADIAGMSEYSFRFVPLLSSLVALPLFARFSGKYLPRPAMLLALGAFALSPPLIRYAAQVKPYESDVTFSLLCLLAAHSWLATESSRNAMRLAVVGVVGIWFSYPVVFVVASVGLIVLLRSAVRWSSSRGRRTAAVLATWMISAGALALVEQHRYSGETKTHMMAFWANWLMPHDLTLLNVSSYLIRLIRDCLTYFLHLPKWPVFFVLLFIGLVYLVRRTQSSALITIPVTLVLAASMLRIYPFSGRLILFVVPNLYVLIAAGIEMTASFALGFANLKNRRTPLHLVALSAGAIVFCLWPLRRLPPPYYNSETKALLSYLGTHRRDGDAIYVQNTAWRAYVFYGPKFGLKADEAIETSPSNILGPKPFVILRDLDHFLGRPRVWLVFAGGYPVEQSCPLEYLDSIGSRVDHQTAFNANVYLYDLRELWGPPKYENAEDFISRSRIDSACIFDPGNPVGPQQ